MSYVVAIVRPDCTPEDRHKLIDGLAESHKVVAVVALTEDDDPYTIDSRIADAVKAAER